MNEGAFAFLDCLGFKGVWNRGVDPSLIVSYLRLAKAKAENGPVQEFAKKYLGSSVVVSIAFISDTVVVSVQGAKNVMLPDLYRGYLIQLANFACIELIRVFANCPKPLAMRGCVTYGPHLVADTFFLGPAVDEAAEYAEIAQGAFVWLTPQAQRYWTAYRSQMPGILQKQMLKATSEHQAKFVEALFDVSHMFVGHGTYLSMDDFVVWWKSLSQVQQASAAPIVIRELYGRVDFDDVVLGYPMPLRAGQTLCAAVLNPFLAIPELKMNLLYAALLSTFDKPGIDVLLKKQNTETFLRNVHHSAITRATKWADRSNEINSALAAATGAQLPVRRPSAKLRPDWREILEAQKKEP